MRRVRAVAATMAALLGGCATVPDAGALLATPIEYKTVHGAPPVRDGRAQFRRTFCAVMRADGRAPDGDMDCSNWLWRLSDESMVSGLEAGHATAGEAVLDSSSPAGSPAIFMFTGAFSECVGEEARPFSSGAAQLRANGARVETIVVSGRSGTGHNARQIAEAIEREPVGAERPLILIGYSKGTLDILRFLVDFPELASTVDAVVSVAGPVYGSPLADIAEPTYATLLAKMPHERCAPGDGQVLRSLSPASATTWLASNPLPAHVRYYSIAGFTTRERVARALRPSWKLLNKTDLRNDGQVVAADAVIPGSTLLGYANADHWGIAERIETVHKVLAARPDATPFPVDQLFHAIVQFVNDDLTGHDSVRDASAATEASTRRAARAWP